MKELLISLGFFLYCPYVDIVNHSKDSWNLEHDQSTLEFNVKARRCEAHYKDLPCLVRIHKLKKQSYYAECGVVRDIAETNITYTKDIKPLFRRRCVVCHNAGARNWMDYDNAFKKKDLIYYRVVKKKDMPPSGWLMTYGERNMVEDWVKGGAKK